MMLSKLMVSSPAPNSTNWMGLVKTQPQSGNTVYEYFSNAAIDSSGNVFVVGYAQNTPAATSQCNLMKITNSGDILWQRKIQGLTVNDQFNSVACDGSGNVIVGGQFKSGSPLAFHSALLKYDTNGNLLWQRKITAVATNTDDNLRGVAADSSGNIYVSISAVGGSSYTMHTIKYNSSGVIQWNKKLATASGTSPCEPYGIGCDSSGNIYIVGYVGYGASSTSTCVIKYDTFGILQWQRIGSGYSSSQSPYKSIAVSSAGDVYICGWSYSNGSWPEALVYKYNTSGVKQWGNRLTASSTSSQSYGVGYDLSGNCYVSGQQSGGHFIVKYDTSGNVLWKRIIQGLNSNNGLATDLSGNSFFLGSYYASTTYSAFIGKFSPDGYGTGTYMPGVTYAVNSTIVNTTDNSDTAGSMVDSAGAVTDVAGSLVNYNVKDTYVIS